MHRPHVTSFIPLRRPGLTLAVLLGMLSGIGGYTFHYAEGTSYFSTDPAACANCHIMNDQYNSWSKGGHHHVAGCVDCHLPHDFVPKYIAKADNGYRHSAGFTFQNFHEPILIKPRNAQILQDNCVRCHADLVHAIAVGGGRDGTPEAVACVHRHRRVGHGG